MFPDLTLWRWQRSIRQTAEKTLGRKLTPIERRFIESRRGMVALEMIDDTVRTTKDPPELERYLNSEASSPQSPT